MLIGAFGYVVGTQASDSIWIGLLVGICFGVALALLHAVATVTFHAEQVVTGIGINILAFGITEYLLPTSEQVGGLPHWQLPVIGSYSFIVYLLPVLMVVSHILLFKTPWGLAIACSGRINRSTRGTKSQPRKMAILRDPDKRPLDRHRWLFSGIGNSLFYKRDDCRTRLPRACSGYFRELATLKRCCCLFSLRICHRFRTCEPMEHTEPIATQSALYFNNGRPDRVHRHIASTGEFRQNETVGASRFG